MTPHLLTFRIRYAESDQMGLAHHAAYVVWLEAARIEWLRAQGLSYRALEEQGVLMPVIELTISYRRPLRFDDEIELSTIAAVLGPSRVAFTTSVRLAGDATVRAEATVVVACVGRDGRPQRLPVVLRTPVAPGSTTP